MSKAAEAAPKTAVSPPPHAVVPEPVKPEVTEPSPAPPPPQPVAEIPPVPAEPAPAPKVEEAPKPVVPTPPPTEPTPAPVVLEPAAPAAPAGPPLRAEAVESPAPVTEMDYAAWQVALERRHFSCGTIDGDYGMRSKRAITQFQKHSNLPVTGLLDDATRAALGTPGNAFTTYTVTAEDMAMIQPPPPLWRDKAKATYLGYNDVWEMLSGKFHCSPQFVQTLNPTEKNVVAGTVLTVPNLEPEFPLPKAGRIVIILNETTLLVYDRKGNISACFPCSIAADKNKRPNGQLTVVTGALNPNYLFNPEVLKEVAAKENITTKMMIPPGPRNPVGLAWVTLSLPGYGIHGTPDPMDISRTGSHGCFRLANWNAIKLYKMVTRGVPVEVYEQAP